MVEMKEEMLNTTTWSIRESNDLKRQPRRVLYHLCRIQNQVKLIHAFFRDTDEVKKDFLKETIKYDLQDSGFLWKEKRRLGRGHIDGYQVVF
jgi:hypothetical protein